MTCTCDMVGLIAGMGGLVFGVLFILMLLFYVKVTGGFRIDEPLSGQTAHDSSGRDAKTNSR